MIRRTRWLTSLPLLAAAFLLALAAGGRAGAAVTEVDFAQCANGTSGATTCENWINGILNTNNSSYEEDQVVPQRLEVLVPAGDPLTGHSITLQYMTRKDVHHAYDSLATWNYTITGADRNQGLRPEDIVPDTPMMTMAIPNDTTAVCDPTPPCDATSLHMLPSGSGRVVTVYGGTITGFSTYTHHNPGTSGVDDTADLTITYEVAQVPQKVQFLFGGHLAASTGPRGWGINEGAGGVSGGPYHFQWIAADGSSIGQRDNQIQSSAIIAPPTCALDNTSASVCAGATASFTVSGSGGVPPYTYSWTGPGGFTASTATITVGVAGTYTAIVTDSNGLLSGGCDAVLTLNAGPTVAVNGPEICLGASATLTATPSGGTAPYTYLWSNAATTQSITVSPATTTNYTVTVTDANGCTGQGQGTVTVDPKPSVTVPDATICEGGSGTLTAAPSGGTAPYTYLWSTGATTQSITVSVAGAYTVTVTDSKGCVSLPATGNLTVDPKPTVTVNSPEVCEGGSTTLTASPSGGTAPYTYSWSTGATTQTITVSVAGDYTVTVTDAKGCVSASATGHLTVNPKPTVTVNSPEICEGGSTTLTASPSGGTAPYTYSWSNGETTQTITVSVAGDYTVTVTDAKGCASAPGTGHLTVDPKPTVSVAPARICEGGSTSLTASPSGGTAPYTYSWSTGATTQSITVSVAGDYTVTVTDAKGCVSNPATGHLTVDPPASVEAGPNQTVCATNPEVTLAGSYGGAATSAVWSGGTGTFNPNAETLNAVYTPSAAEILAGGVTLTLTTDDPAGPCDAVSDLMHIQIDPEATVNAGTDQTICASTGSVQLAGTFGGAATSVTWTTSGDGSFSDVNDKNATYTPGAQDILDKLVTLTLTTNDPIGLCPAVYDNVLIHIEPVATVDAGPDREACASSPTVTMAGSFGGAATAITWSGGEGIFSDIHDPLATYTPSAAEIAAGSVVLTLTTNDPEGPCGPVSDTVLVTIHPLPTVSVVGAEICFGSSATLTAVTNAASPSYLWSTGETTASITVSPGGTTIYSVTVTDGVTTCQNITSATVIVNPKPTVSVAPAEVCEGGSTSLTASPSGGTPPYSYLWSTGATTQSITVSVAGDYTVTVTDSKGCVSASATGHLTVNPKPTVTVNSPEVCEGGSETLTASPSGGTAPYTYLWSTGATTQSITVSVAGDYTVTVTDAKGCVSAPATGHLTVNPKPTVSVANAEICDGASATLTALSSGGTAPYTYSWSNGETTQSITVSVAGDYTVTVTDAKGCVSAPATGHLTVNPNPVADITAPGSLCTGSTGNVASVADAGPGAVYDWTITNGTIESTPPYGYSITFTAGNDSSNPTHLAVTVTLTTGCTDEASVDVPLEACYEFCTVTQGFWGSAASSMGKFNGMLAANLLTCLLDGTGVTVGVPGVRSLTITDAACVMSRLPAGGAPSALPNFGAGIGGPDRTISGSTCNTTNPSLPLTRGRFLNVLLGQTITLSLNLTLDGSLGGYILPDSITTVPALPGPDGIVGEPLACIEGGADPNDDLPNNSDPLNCHSITRTIPSSLQGMTVNQLLTLANQALAGIDTGFSLDDINKAVSAVNEVFDQCRFLGVCPPVFVPIN